MRLYECHILALVYT